MSTTKLYQNDVYMRRFNAVIISAEPDTDEKNRALLLLDRTAFFPWGGGQSCDTGFIDKWKVLDVKESKDEIYHLVELDNQEMPPHPGQEVLCHIDWNRRFDNMQRHCGEHILSGIFFNLYGGINRGFHMGADYMTIDMSLEEKSDIEEITWEMALQAELEANKVIWSDAPVRTIRFASREEAEEMPLRKALAFDEDISIVCVGSQKNAADCVACCGTHPSSAGQVGLVKIYKVEKYKGMFRIYFEAGERALKDYDLKHNILTNLSNDYSSSIADFPDKLKLQSQKLATLKNDLFHLKKALIQIECSNVDACLEALESKVLVYSLKHLTIDDAFNMSKNYMGKSKSLIMLYSVQDSSYILVSDGSFDCGSLVKEYAPFYHGKGGGNKVSARAIFEKDEDANLFADLIQKHLR